MIYKVNKMYKFEAAHRLMDDNSECANLHGHSYKVEVELKAKSWRVRENDGKVLDFNIIDDIVGNLIDDLDHSYLNEVLATEEMNTTAENLAAFVFDQVANGLMAESLCTGVRVSKVRVYETEKCFAEVTDDA